MDNTEPEMTVEQALAAVARLTADQALKALDETAALDVITSWLTTHDMPYKVWMAEDIRSTIDGEYDAETTEQIVELAQGSGYWRDLSDCTDQDWDRVHLAIGEAVTQLQL